MLLVTQWAVSVSEEKMPASFNEQKRNKKVQDPERIC